MKEIIALTRIELDGQEINSVSTRELHEYLEVKRVYTSWIIKRLEQLGAIENEDYVKIIYTKTGVNKREKRGRKQVDYIVGIDIGKHLSMMERNEKGREARQYFIDVEKVVADHYVKTLPNGLKSSLDDILPDLNNLGKQNKNGLPRTKLIRAYFKVDNGDPRIHLYKDIYQLRELHETGFFDLSEDIEIKMIQIKEYENEDLLGGV